MSSSEQAVLVRSALNYNIQFFKLHLYLLKIVEDVKYGIVYEIKCQIELATWQLESEDGIFEERDRKTVE